MRTTYIIKIRLPLAKVFESVAKLEDVLNSTMSDFGFDEKLHTTYLQEFETTTSRELTAAEIKLLANGFETEFAKSFGSATVESITLLK